MKSCVSRRMEVVVWKDYMERIMNEECEWDRNVGDVVEGTVGCIRRYEVVLTLNEMKTGKPLDLQMYDGSGLLLVGKSDIKLCQSCQRSLDV